RRGRGPRACLRAVGVTAADSPSARSWTWSWVSSHLRRITQGKASLNSAQVGNGWRGQPGRGGAAAALIGHVVEAGVVALEGDGDDVGGPVTVLGDDDVRLAGAAVGVVGVLAVEQHDDVGV